MNQHSLSLLGYASGIAAGDSGCGDGPPLLQKSALCNELANAGIAASWLDMLYPIANADKLLAVAEICTRLAQHTRHIAEQKKLFAVFGGDHSSAIGTWSGVYAAHKQQGAIGLLWIDAHMDSHTPGTSPSGNIHGMPVAHLLGHGAPELAGILDKAPKLQPEHVCLIGIRSFEAGEAELIKRLGVRTYYMDEVNRRGIKTVMQEALQIVQQGTVGYGVSIDLDGLDPNDAPAVGTPEPHGIIAKELYPALAMLAGDAKLLGIEIAEFNPHHDRNKQTEKVIQQLLLILLKGA
jgi:arginase